MKTLKDLEIMYEKAKMLQVSYIGIVVKTLNGRCELIVNTLENFEDKMEYYKSAYNEDLTLKSNRNIRIVDFEYSILFGTLEKLFSKKYSE